MIEFVNKAKYLGVMFKVGRNFGVDVQYMKSNFYHSFNSVFHRVAWCQNELVVLQLVTSILLSTISVILYRMPRVISHTDAQY